jgi:6-phosphogluconolactonase (cycloisomerase 2 family)
MRQMRSCRCVLSVSLFAVSISLAIALSGCGGSTSAANNSAPTAPTTTTPPAGTGTAGSGTPPSSGTGTGSGGSGSSGTPSGGSGGSGGTPTPSSTGNRYLYVGIGGNQGGVDGFKVDPTTGAMTEVPGAPLLFGTAQDAFSQAGPVAAVKGFVFVGFGPPNFGAPVIRSYAIDSATGQLGNFTQVDAGAQDGDEQLRALVIDASGRNLYVVYQNNIASFQINSDGSLLFLGSATNLATAFIQALTISPTGQLAFLMVDNCPPKGNNCTGPPDFLLLNRDPNSGALSNTGKLMRQNNVSDVTGLIGTGFDNTGKYFVAWTVNNTSTSSISQVTVYSVDYTQQNLTPVNSYTTINQGTVTSLPPVAFAFDSTNSFLYVLEASAENEQPEALVVYSFDQKSGALSQLQVQSLPSGHFPGGMVVDDSFVYVIDSLSGSNASAVYVLPHDATGKVSAPVFTQNEVGQALGSGAELQF